MARNPITIEALEALDAIDRRGSFASAAEELGKATSALSYIVQKLEEQLEITLFTRQGRRSVLTPAGLVVLEDGRQILHATRRLADRSREVATGWEPRLKISVGAPCDYADFFRATKLFVDEHPSVELDIQEHILNGGWELLENDEVDLVVNIPGPVPQNKGYRSVDLGKNDLALVAAANQPIAKLKGEALDKALLQERRVVAHDTTSRSIATSAGLVFDSDACFVQTMEQKVEAQLAGIGIGHLPRSRIQSHLNSGALVELKTPRSLKNESIFMVWKLANKGRALKAITQIYEKVLVNA